MLLAFSFYLFLMTCFTFCYMNARRPSMDMSSLWVDGVSLPSLSGLNNLAIMFSVLLILWISSSFDRNSKVTSSTIFADSSSYSFPTFICYSACWYTSHIFMHFSHLAVRILSDDFLETDWVDAWWWVRYLKSSDLLSNWSIRSYNL